MKLSFKLYPKFSLKAQNIIEELSFHTTKLYNTANYDCHINGFKSYVDMEKLFKGNWHREYLHSHNYQHNLKLVEQDWKSYFQAFKDYSKSPNKYLAMPKPPKYKNTDNRKNQIIFTNLAVRFKDDTVLLSLSKKVQSLFNVKSLNFELPKQVQKHINIDSLQQIKLAWDNSQKSWYAIIIYNKEETISPKLGSNIMSIDLGLDNLCAISFKDTCAQILLDGKSLKSKNSYYNKEISRYTGIAMKQCKGSKHFKRTKEITKLQKRRNDYINNALHQTSNYLVKLALEKGCLEIVVGDIKGIKQKNKAKGFVQIPIQKLVDQIKYKSNLVGIKVVLIKEHYTSGTSALDLEPVTKAFYNKKRRIERGLFKSNTGILVNADINGSLNILRKYLEHKCIPRLLQVVMDNGYVANPIRIRVA